jgi:hypothetical protein
MRCKRLAAPIGARATEGEPGFRRSSAASWQHRTNGRAGAPGRAPRLGQLLIVVMLMVASLLPVGQAVAQDTSTSSSWSPPVTVYIPETGQTLDRLFLDLWRGGGGAAAFGYPITPEITTEDGHIVQYLQYARFEYWPEGDENGNTVLLGNIGEELRPVAVLRPSLASVQSDGQGMAAAESIRQMVAWLPVDAGDIDTSRGDLVYVEATQHTISAGFLTFWQNSGAEAYLGNPLTEEFIVGGTTYQIFERGKLAWEPGKSPWLVPVGEHLVGKYNLDTTPVAQGDVPTYSEELFVPPPDPVFEVDNPGPGPVPGAPKSIVVSISQQRMWAYEGDVAVLSTFVSTGKPGFDTPTGLFTVIVKKEIEDMEGLIGGEYYNVPDVPDVMYFTNVGHAIHGTYWHNNFGAVMSHGCVNLPLDVAAFLYDWTPMGTPVLVVP